MAWRQRPRVTSDRSFRRGLREQGYVDGRNVVIELRYAQSGPQQLPDLVADLVRMKVDVIWAAGDLAPKVAEQRADWDNSHSLHR